MGNLFRDLRFTLRQLRHSPGFSLAAILTLAVGIGASTAMFSVVDGVLLRPLPYPDADRLVRVWHFNTRNDVPKETVSFETFQELADGVGSLSAAAGISPGWSFTVRAAGAPERVQGYWVSDSFFDLLGVDPLLGRGFLPEEDRVGGAPVAVIGHSLWQRMFGGAPDVLGRTLTIGSESAAVIGVMEPGFRFGEAAELWVPLAQNPLVPRGRQVRWVDVVAQLAPGTSVDVAGDEVAGFMRRLEEAYPEANGGLGATVEGLHTAIVGDVRPALWALLGGVTFVLLITCSNIANLLLARASARRGELAIRKALGASGSRLSGQLLTESVALSLMGALVGAILAVGIVDLFRAVGPGDLPRLQEVTVDLRILSLAAAMALVTGLVIGLAPVLTALRGDVHAPLAEGGRAMIEGGRRLRRGFVASQVAIALVLLTGGGLFLRSFGQLMEVDPGFRPEGVLTFQMALPEGYDPDRSGTFYEALFADLAAIPEVSAVGGVTRLPLGGTITTRLDIRGRDYVDADQPEVQFRRATGGYFEAMGIPLLSGRSFDERDHASSPPVMLLNRAAAEALWPGEDPVGQQVRFWFAGITDDDPWLEIVGVTGDTRDLGLAMAAPPTVFVPFSQGPPGSPLIAVSTAGGDPADLMGPVSARARSLEPGVVLWDVRTMSDRVRESVAGRWFAVLLTAAFGALALALAGVGIYGVIAYAVRRRTREIGVRLALGATATRVVRLVFREGAGPILLGVAVGLIASLGAARLLDALLFGVSPVDPWSFGGAVLVLCLVAAAAILIPARRAASVHPMSALRAE